MAYLPNKVKTQNETYKHRSTHEQKSDGKFNKDSVLTYDSNESDYDGSESDSEKELKLVVESDDADTRSLWRD